MSVKPGDTYGRWTVLSLADPYLLPSTGKKFKQWFCLCSCEKKTEKVILQNNLVRGRHLSCGCLMKEINAQARRDEATHGDSRHGEFYHLYLLYHGMVSRCNTPSAGPYKYYGARGITVCEEWSGQGGYERFKDWALGNGWVQGLTIDRIDVDGNYQPENCRWVGWDVQARNKRKRVTKGTKPSEPLPKNITYNGETRTISAWAREKGLSCITLWKRLNESGWSIEDALNTPPRRKRK